MTTNPSAIAVLTPAINSLAMCLERTSIDYAKLLSNSDTYSETLEAGRSLRFLANCYAKVLCAALEYPFDDINDDDEDWDNDTDQDDDDSLD